MPMTAKNGIASRQQTIMGPARSIDTPRALEPAACTPKRASAVTVDTPAPTTIAARGVPIPRHSGSPTPFRAVIAKLKAVGDFVHVVPDENYPDVATSITARRAVQDAARQAKIKVALRRNFEHKGRVGLGVWRIE